MWSKSDSLFLVVIFSIINQNFSAIFLSPEFEAVADDSNDDESASTYKGLLLSYSPAMKKQLCADYFSAQLYLAPEPRGHEIPTPEQTGDTELENYVVIDFGSVESDTRSDKYITDGLNTEGGPQFPLTVKKLGLYQKEQTIMETPSICFRCVGQNFVHRNGNSFSEYYVSFALRPGWWHAAVFDKDFSPKVLYLAYYANSSPEHVSLQQEQLEEQYANTRRIIDTLRRESPAYVDLIESKKLLALPKWQQRHLCASILSSPTYRVDRLEYSSKWADKKNNPPVEEISLAFENEDYKTAFENSKHNCIVCKGFENGDHEDRPSTNLYLLESYDNKGSVYIGKPADKGIFLSKYFVKAPILVNIRKPIREMELYKNYLF